MVFLKLLTILSLLLNAALCRQRVWLTPPKTQWVAQVWEVLHPILSLLLTPLET